MKRNLLLWFRGLVVLLAVGGAVEAQACCRPFRAIGQAIRSVGRVATAPVRLIRRIGPCNRVDVERPAQMSAPSTGTRHGCPGGVCPQ